ncbi:hypothetical protein BRD09_00630 [Halobacteriales archaeon SW_10_68_16]|nr:MAG: hypothetical protein BRD09_00630 [Halobacteriales archaeon SW_10_68_16]
MAVFLLLVSAAVATLTLVPDEAPEPVVVDERADLLASSTADVEYTVGTETRSAHGTTAALLARGAVANATVDGQRLSGRHEEFVESVAEASQRTLGPDNRTQIVVRWVPYRGAPLRGTLRVGPAPPPGRDVTVATLSVPAPVHRQGDRAAVAAREQGFRGVAGVAARATADALLPESSAALPSSRVSPASAVVSERFATLADATGVSVDGPLSRGNVSAVRERIVEGLTARYAADMRERYETPRAAADAIQVGTVRIALRRWAG